MVICPLCGSLVELERGGSLTSLPRERGASPEEPAGDPETELDNIGATDWESAAATGEEALAGTGSRRASSACFSRLEPPFPMPVLEITGLLVAAAIPVGLVPNPVGAGNGGFDPSVGDAGCAIRAPC
jgi:hypothetical protein